MKSNECKRFCLWQKECDINGGICQYDIEVANHKDMERAIQLAFGCWTKEKQLEFIHEYRKLELLSYVLADSEDNPFDLILDIVESYMPAYEWDQIHDENNDINNVYTELIEMSRNEDITDKEFLERVTSKVCFISR